MNEIPYIEQWIYSKLTGDSALNTAVSGRIYSYVAPEKAACPLVVFSPLSQQGVNGIGGKALYESQYTIKAIGQNMDVSALSAITDRIDAIFKAAGPDTVNTSLHVRSLYQNSVSYTEEQADGVYLHMGAVFRIKIGRAHV